MSSELKRDCSLQPRRAGVPSLEYCDGSQLSVSSSSRTDHPRTRKHDKHIQEMCSFSDGALNNRKLRIATYIQIYVRTAPLM
jgi:hypothetical protein